TFFPPLIWWPEERRAAHSGVPRRCNVCDPAAACENFVRTMKLLIIGFAQAGHMGSYLVSAARQLGLDCWIADASDANARSRIGRSIYWHLRGKRPARLDQFGAQVLEICAKMQPSVVLATGHAPLGRSHIEILRGRGVRVVNYSTDDPWNPTL